MDITSSIPSLQELKTSAKRLRIRLRASGEIVNHATSLERIAHQMGYRDWNTLHARSSILQAGCPFAVGDTVSGSYIGIPFTGRIIKLSWIHQLNQTRVTIHFDDPVDVVSFDSFSSYRKQVNCTLNMDYRSDEVTTAGVPIMQFDQ